MKSLPKESKILNALLAKADLKQQIYTKATEGFALIREELNNVSSWIDDNIKKQGVNASIHSVDRGEYETEFKFAGDTLFFIMHTNIFTFPPENFIYKTAYVKEDPTRAFFGMIMIYNFLSDSISYTRVNDIGYLLGRVFINKDNHYFMQGKKQYSFLHRDFSNLIFNKTAVRSIVEIAITQAVYFDLFVPPIENAQQISLLEKIQSTGTLALKTGKRVGFDLDLYDQDPNGFKMMTD